MLLKFNIKTGRYIIFKVELGKQSDLLFCVIYKTNSLICGTFRDFLFEHHLEQSETNILKDIARTPCDRKGRLYRRKG